MIRLIPILDRGNYRFTEAFKLSFGLDPDMSVYGQRTAHITTQIFRNIPQSVRDRYRRSHTSYPTSLYVLDNYSVTKKELRECIDGTVAALVKIEDGRRSHRQTDTTQ
jgi:hypothetical protein